MAVNWTPGYALMILWRKLAVFCNVPVEVILGILGKLSVSTIQDILIKYRPNFVSASFSGSPRIIEMSDKFRERTTLPPTVGFDDTLWFEGAGINPRFPLMYGRIENAVLLREVKRAVFFSRRKRTIIFPLYF